MLITLYGDRELLDFSWLSIHEGEGRKVKSLNHVRLFVTPWTVAYQAPPSMGFSRQEYWSGLPFPSPGDLPYPGIKPRSPTLEADALTSEPPGKPLQHLYLPIDMKSDIIPLVASSSICGRKV